MASIHQGGNGNYNISFRHDGRQVMKSCKTKSKREARIIQGSVDATLNKIRCGQLEVPEGVEPADFIMSGGKIKAIAKEITLKKAGETYIEEARDKGEQTIRGEKRHLKHFYRILGENTKLDRIDLEAMKRYIKRRLADDNRSGGKVSGKTIHKELITFEQLWKWAYRERHVITHSPTKDPADPRKRVDFKLPKDADKPPFRTWAEIERKVTLDKLTPEEAKQNWAGLYLDDTEIQELLDYVKGHERYSFMYLPFVLAARTGMRRGEIAKAHCSDVHLSENLIEIREGKRKKAVKESTRHCILSESLRKCLENENLDRDCLVVNADGKHLSEDMLSDQFRMTLKGSKWEVLRGWHTLRHSFASICLRKGVPIHVTAKWMGHSTQEMIELYQKVFIQDEHQFAKLLD